MLNTLNQIKENGIENGRNGQNQCVGQVESARHIAILQFSREKYAKKKPN